MLLNLSERSSERVRAVSHATVSAMRMIVGAYFLAKATGLMLVPNRSTFLDGLFSAPTALGLTTALLCWGGLSFLSNVALRPTATLMILYTFGVTGHGVLAGLGDPATVIAQGTLLLSGIVMVAWGHPGKASRIMEFLRIRRAMMRSLPVMPNLPNMRQKRADSDIDLTARRPAILSEHDLDEWGDDDAGNLFDEIWDAAPPKSRARSA